MLLSSLSKTYIFDLDGTILVHNGYRNGEEELLPGVKQFFQKYITKEDCVILITARKSKYREETIGFLHKNNIPFDHIIFDLPHGERILFNDKKNSGLETSYSINLVRNEGLRSVEMEISEDL